MKTSIIEEIKSELLRGNADAASGIRKCDLALRSFTRLLHKAKGVGEKQKLVAEIGLVRSLKAMYYNLRKTNAGLTSRRETASNRVKWADAATAFRSRIRTGIITNLKHVDPKIFLEDASFIFNRKILSVLKREAAIKVNVIFCGEFTIIKKDEQIYELKYFNTKNFPIYRGDNLPKWFTSNVQNPILKQLEEFQERESGWSLSAIINLQVNINKFTLQVGSSYIELPLQIQKKHACINVRNDDDMCFAWAVTSALYPAETNPQRTSNYPHPSDVLNLTGLQFPMTIKQLSRFENLNDVSINVYTLKKVRSGLTVLPCVLSKSKRAKHVNLLLIQDYYYDDDDDDYDDVGDDGVLPRYHYVWIKDLSRLLWKQLTKRKSKLYFCDRCLHYFYSEAKLHKHYVDCMEINECKIRMPTEENKFIKFRNFKNKVKTPFIIYADLECLLVPCGDGNKYQEHQPCSIAYYLKCSYDDSLSLFRLYRGDDCISWFTKELQSLAENLETVFLCPIPMDPLTPEEQLNYDNATHCHICEKHFTPDDVKVRDHFHLASNNNNMGGETNYRGPAHQDCNLGFQDDTTVPVVFHNLSGYDSHFIIKDLATAIDGKVNILPINKERYISFTKHIDMNLIKFRFIDSFRFMASGLNTLASYLPKHPELASQYPELKETKLVLLAQKGIYPYDYFTSVEKFQETSLPDKTDFYNRLTDSHISQEDYLHAQRVWMEFNCENLGQYSDLYLKTDVLLLADIFEQFRQSCLCTYGLDPAHYHTLPGYTWDCMLKYTDVNLELLTDIDMLMFVERGVRGGLSQSSLRYFKANNKYMADYNPELDTSYLLYTDINNQYGWAMSQSLPFGEFKWVNPENFNVMAIDDDCHNGFLLDVDLMYPQQLHDLHRDIPFCPEHRSPAGSKEPKLMATLYDKNNYIIHYRTLKQALSHGIKLMKIHRILQFKQSAWLKPYIDLNTKLRTAARNQFEKNLFKLMNNAVFGKTMENIRKYSNVKLVTKWEGRYGAEALIAKPEFKNSLIFDDNLVAIELNKTELFFNKPIYVGQAILDISKTKIYEFHYDYMKPLFGDKCRAAYTDTDSIIYAIECSDVYKYIKRDCYERFDTSDYSEDNIYGVPLVNKKVLGLMKDEMAGKIITEFTGLRSKMYAIRVEGEDYMKKAKGVKQHIVKNRLTFDNYIACLQDGTENYVAQNLIKSVKHQVSSITNIKIALSPHDDKRYLIKNSYSTLPWGHYSIMDAEEPGGSRKRKPTHEVDQLVEKTKKAVTDNS